MEKPSVPSGDLFGEEEEDDETPKPKPSSAAKVSLLSPGHAFPHVCV